MKARERITRTVSVSPEIRVSLVRIRGKSFSEDPDRAITLASLALDLSLRMHINSFDQL